ncbi:uncharacterized protein [Atheta coriaria]|uniref:uncharacterized protein n=1 Tax=Dalotia coriaria TaxID=877792 RepID=UPI0031F3E06A
MFKLLCVALTLVVLEVSGHGMMLDPPNRSSLWRFDDEAPINYNDNENFCGGAGVQHHQNGGKCGLCGDNYANAHPQANENTGIYGTGKIVAEYQAGEVITVGVTLTTNHLGHFEYHLCKLDDPSRPETGEECFQQLTFEDGSLEHQVLSGVKEFSNRLRLPSGFSCPHCVLRWHYRGGNNWGTCEDGSQAQGCGPQETFRNCADIRIN